MQVFDQDIGQDKRLGIAKLPLRELEADTSKEIQLRLMPSLDMLKIKDKKDRGTISIKVAYLMSIFNFTCNLLYILFKEKIEISIYIY